LTNHHPSVLWHCWLGHVTSKIVSEMTYNVSSGTLNSTILYYFFWTHCVADIAVCNRQWSSGVIEWRLGSITLLQVLW